jgi:membrane-associated phospholipid phosphatase
LDDRTKEALMSKKNFSILFVSISLVILSTCIFICIKYLDTPVAIKVMHLLRSFHEVNKVTRNIPDFLPHFVTISSILMWVIYFYRLQKKRFDIETQFLKLGGAVLPAAYLVKTLLKFPFGRTSPRSWLLQNQPLKFHWFKMWSSSFPSGHMVVFVAFGTAILIYYPQYRNLVLIFLILLGAALVLTDYHFLSDVIAGACFGIMTTFSVYHLLPKQSPKT